MASNAAAPGRVVVGITGATGAVYGLKLLQRLKAAGRETHLVVSPAGVLNAHHELGLDRKALEALAHTAYNPADVGAAIASGSQSQPRSRRVCPMRTSQAVTVSLAAGSAPRISDLNRRVIWYDRARPRATRWWGLTRVEPIPGAFP